MHPAHFPERKSVLARALFVGERIDLRALETSQRLASMPLTVSAGAGGCAVLFRYGAVVMFDLSPVQQSSFLADLDHLISDRFPTPSFEEAEVRFHAPEEGFGQGCVLLADSSLERLQVVADVLAKSAVLAHYESAIARVFDQIEPLAARLERTGRAGYQSRELLKQIGGTLLVQHKMVGRVQVAEKPDILWECPELERLYLRLDDEYELRERHVALERKLDVISRTTETVLDLLRNRSNMRVEWYIVGLIVFEILLTLYQLFVRR